MKKIKLSVSSLIVVIFIVSSSCTENKKSPENTSKEELRTDSVVSSDEDKKSTQATDEFTKMLQTARSEFHKEKYDKSLEVLQKYLDATIGKSGQEFKHFIVISTMGKILLRFKNDPKELIQKFKKLEADSRFNEMEQDLISAWIAATKEWVADMNSQKKNLKADELFNLGKKYYLRGRKKSKYLADRTGFADFQIAATYLMPFIRKYDQDPKIQEAFLYLGDIRLRSWPDNQYWSENVYLTEAIQKNPKSQHAKTALQLLKEDVEFGYSGSGGVHIPKSWLNLLKKFDEQVNENTASTTSKKNLH
ncbi:MAG: hypothetical protein CL678_12010 [Bdellovibrionaceae bacterium]|nr:hypothetical protein [Pseudobdellovibrionaceae bacterium]|tara:strand:+ start:269 stop:1186 length:918 start_codon:yes stop_codon:yes gene_type:complete